MFHKCLGPSQPNIALNVRVSPTRVTVSEGMPATINCSATSSDTSLGPIVFDWFFVPILGTQNVTLLNHIQMANGQSLLHVTNVTFQTHQGEYYCRATVEEVQSFSKAFVDVQCKQILL